MEILLLTVIFIMVFSSYVLASYAVFRIKPCRRYPLPLLLGIYICIIVVNNNSHFPKLLLLHILALIAFLLTNHYTNCVKALLVFLATSCVGSMNNYLLKMSAKEMFTMAYGEYFYSVSEQFLVLIIIVILLLVNRHNRLLKTKKGNIRFWKVFLGILMVAALLLALSFGSLNVAGDNVQSEKDKVFISVLGIAGYMAIIAVIVMVLMVKQMNNRLQELLYTEQELRKMQERYYDSIRGSVEETVKYRHDMANHLMVLKQLSYERNMDKIQEYVDEMEKGIITIREMTINTGNSLLDIIFNYFASRWGKDVVIEIRGHANENLRINDYDLCRIFANLLQNIDDEKNKHTERSIIKVRLEIYSGTDFIKFVLRNTRQESEEKSVSGVRYTSKTDKDNHGYGLLNVQEVVEKNHGIFIKEETSKEFVIHVGLLLDK